MDYPRCQTCKWWRRDPEYPARQYETMNVNPGPDWGQCIKTCANDPDSDAALTSRALSVATDVYASDNLWTAPDFGCIQHQPKDVDYARFVEFGEAGIKGARAERLPPGPDNFITRTPYPFAPKTEGERE